MTTVVESYTPLRGAPISWIPREEYERFHSSDSEVYNKVDDDKAVLH